MMRYNRTPWMARLVRLVLISSVMIGMAVGTTRAQTVDEGSEEKASTFLNSFGFHEPMFFAFGEGKPDNDSEAITFSKFQISFRFELLDFYPGERPADAPSRGINIAYTQTSFWDLESKSQPFFDTSYKPSAFLLYQFLGGRNMGWVSRLDLETGYQHHSNGKDGQDSRFIDLLYIKPTFVWRAASSHFFFAPKAWVYFTKSRLNADIADYFGYVDLEATWRADFGLQLETHTIPAKEVVTFNAQATYPLSKLWQPLNFYALVDFWSGAGETLLRYDVEGTGFLFGIALSR